MVVSSKGFEDGDILTYLDGGFQLGIAPLDAFDLVLPVAVADGEAVFFLLVEGLLAFVEGVGLLDGFRVGLFQQLLELLRGVAIEVDVDVLVRQSDGIGR